jgi:cytochrome c553
MVAVLLLRLTPVEAEQDIATGRQIAVLGTQPGHASCAACHLVNGAGQPMQGIPRLAGLPTDYLGRQLSYFADGKRDSVIMAPYAKGLSAAQRQAVAAYFASQPPVPQNDSTTPSSGQLARGKNLFENGLARYDTPACAKCHGADGRGIGDFSPPLAGQSSPYIAHQLRQWRSGVLRGPTGTFMRAEASHLSDADIDAVAVYVAELPASPPTENGDHQ